MVDEKTLENYKVIENLVHEKFNLTDESKGVFSRFLYEQNNAIEFEKIYSQPDRRLWFEHSALSEKEDTIWQSFSKSFALFSRTITYTNFTEGRIGEKKFLTFFIEHMSSNISLLKELFIFSKSFDVELFDKFINRYFPKSYEKIIKNIEKSIVDIKDDRLIIKVGSTLYKKKFNEKETSILLKSLKTEISDTLNKHFFGKKRSTSGKKICFSLNYADWFLSSYGESWYSCVSYSDSSGNWRGIPGLVGDTNRLLVFVTDGTEKTFQGVKSFKMFERCWCFLYKETGGQKVLSANRNYPCGTFSFDKYKHIFPNDIKFGKESGKTYLSLYRFPTLFQKSENKVIEKISMSIAEDSHAKVLNTENINECWYDTTRSYGIYCYEISKDKVIKQTSNKSGSFQ